LPDWRLNSEVCCPPEGLSAHPKEQEQANKQGLDAVYGLWRHPFLSRVAACTGSVREPSIYNSSHHALT